MIKIFTDFDGTITLQDVGDAMFETFGGQACKEAVRQYREGTLSAVECFRQECLACGPVDLQRLNTFLDEQKIDPSFIDFVKWCRSQALDCVIVSDGMDYYIKYILDHHDLADVNFFANELKFIRVNDREVTFEPLFPFRDEVCDRCACCKRNILLTQCADDDIIVYIGEGYSDRCPARYADVVFAKDDLLTYCQKENISYHEYQSFADITKRMDSMLSKKRADGTIVGLRKRRQAELARKDVFIGG